MKTLDGSSRGDAWAWRRSEPRQRSQAELDYLRAVQENKRRARKAERAAERRCEQAELRARSNLPPGMTPEALVEEERLFSQIRAQARRAAGIKG